MSLSFLEAAAKDPRTTVIVRGERMFKTSAVLDSLAAELNSDQCSFFQRGFKMEVKKDLASATEACDAGTKAFGAAVAKLKQTQSEAAAVSREASQATRKACNEISEGWQKLEKTVNLERLERLASTLERTASAMTILAELDKAGRLSRISEALK